MAKISFQQADGSEKSWHLSTQRTLRIGREPGNDIVLRDSKVSRRHAEVVFEKGFFVLRDLESANGCFVNGRRIRVAPLIEGAEIKIGNTLGRFTEGLNPESSQTATHDLLDGRPPAEAVDAAPVRVDPDPGANTPVVETPYLDIPTFVPDEDPKATRIRPPVEPRTKRTEGAWGKAAITFVLPSKLQAIIRPDQGTATLWFRRSLNLVGFVASLIALMISLVGMASTFFLFTERQIAPAVASLVLTAIFAFIILVLIPRRGFALYFDDLMREQYLTIAQMSRFPFPSLVYEVSNGGRAIGSLRKNSFSNLLRRKWKIFDGEGRWIGHAIEHSLAKAVIRKFTGHFFAALKTNFVLFDGSGVAGLIDRSKPSGYDVTLAIPHFPRDLVLALVVVLDSVER